MQDRFFNLSYIRSSGQSITPQEVERMAKTDYVMANKFNWDDVNGDTWGSLRALNPDIEITLYTVLINSDERQDFTPTQNLNSTARWADARGHSMGNIRDDNYDLVLLDADGNEIVKNWGALEKLRMLEFGNPQAQKYIIEACITDHVGRPWSADGIKSDNCVTKQRGDLSGIIAKYDTPEKYSAAMNSLLNAVTVGLHEVGQTFSADRGGSRSEHGFNAWLELDQTPNPPDSLLEEVAFSAGAGPDTVDTLFLTPTEWQRNVEIYRQIKNSRVNFLLSTRLAPGESGVDQWGQAHTYWDFLYYGLGSYLMGKNDVLNNSYMQVTNGAPRTTTQPGGLVWHDEFDKIDFGKALGEYTSIDASGVEVFTREFEKGWVYVNPQKRDDAFGIELPGPGREITHDQLDTPIPNLGLVQKFDLGRHKSRMFYRAKEGELIGLNPPTNIRIHDLGIL